MTKSVTVPSAKTIAFDSYESLGLYVLNTPRSACM